MITLASAAWGRCHHCHGVAISPAAKRESRNMAAIRALNTRIQQLVMNTDSGRPRMFTLFETNQHLIGAERMHTTSRDTRALRRRSGMRSLAL